MRFSSIWHFHQNATPKLWCLKTATEFVALRRGPRVLQMNGRRLGMFIYKLLGYISSIAVFLCIITLGYYLFVAIRSLVKKEKLSYTDWIRTIKSEILGFAGGATQPLLIISLLATIITSTTVHQLIGIHNLEIKPEGTYCFYVEATRSGGKTYTLPAQIRVEKETEEVAEGKSRTYTYYYVEKVFFSNGGWLDFEHEDSVDINDTTLMCNDEDEWRIRLLNEHAYSPYVTETSNAESDDIAWMFVETIPVLFLLCACLIPLKETEEE